MSERVREGNIWLVTTDFTYGARHETFEKNYRKGGTKVFQEMRCQKYRILYNSDRPRHSTARANTSAESRPVHHDKKASSRHTIVVMHHHHIIEKSEPARNELTHDGESASVEFRLFSEVEVFPETRYKII